MSESITLYVQSREAFDAVLAEVFRRSDLFDLGSDDEPVVAASGHASLFIGHGCDPLGRAAEDQGMSEGWLPSGAHGWLRGCGCTGPDR